MTTENMIIASFCEVDHRPGDGPKHPQACCWPSEPVTIRLLFVLRGVQFRALYWWLKRDDTPLFVRLSHRTRLVRALQVHQAWTDRLLADPTFFTYLLNNPGVSGFGARPGRVPNPLRPHFLKSYFFTVVDSDGMIHSIREGRSRAQIGRKGKSNHRWIVGIKRCWLINDKGAVVDWTNLPGSRPGAQGC